MLEDHWLGVMRWHHSRVSNGLLEGLNSLVQAAKRRARGYRTNRNYIPMIYLVAGTLNPGPAQLQPHTKRAGAQKSRPGRRRTNGGERTACGPAPTRGRADDILLLA